MAFPKYHHFATCQKCGGVNASASYLRSMELIQRQCRNCTYIWHEAPLDSDDEPSIPELVAAAKAEATESTKNWLAAWVESAVAGDGGKKLAKLIREAEPK